jgi:predicted ATPase
MPGVVLTGGPGAGKTALLSELGTRGYAIVDESARAIIAERIARGLSARPELPIFAREILRRDVERYRRLAPGPEWIFFDRGVLDAIALLQEVDPLPMEDLQRLLSAHPFHALVFILPPWESIYTNDAERDQTFAEAVHVHGKLQRWYHSCGYRVHEVPRLSVQQRADHVLQTLSQSDG